MGLVVSDKLPPSPTGMHSKPVTIRDVAVHAGVSRSTVSYALTQPDRLSADTLKRVTASFQELGYIGNDAARQLRVGHSRAIGLIVSNTANPIYAELADGADREATLHGRFILLANSRESLQRERDYIAFFESQQVSGILIAPVDEVPDELIELGQRGTPFVLIGTPSKPDAYRSLSGDNTLGGHLAASHLIAQGRRKLLYVGGHHLHAVERSRGAQAAVTGAGNTTLEVVRVAQQTAGEGEAVARALLTRPRAGLPDGIFCGNDLLALGLMHTLLAAGIGVPADVSLVGYDDIAFADFAVVPLTTIRHPSAELGAGAVQLLMGTLPDDQIANTEASFQPRLVVRKSSLATA